MLTKGDEYPIHQLPEPIAYAGSDPNFYDRYFFNGYSMEDEAFFAMALGVYPHVNIIDASFSVIKDGIQHNLRASRHLGMERMDTNIGPISLEILEPLKSLRIVIDKNEHGIEADVTFTARIEAVEEPRYIRRVGPRMLMDLTRMTQNGGYRGWIDIKGEKMNITPEEWFGTRDRSWGVRPISSQMPTLDVLPQFYWLWAPANFEDCCVLYDINQDDEGNTWHTHGVIAPIGVAAPEEMKRPESQVKFKSGTRHAASAVIRFWNKDEEETQIHIEPLYQFYMSGLGYAHPEWGHGMNKGELATAYDTIDLESVDETSLLCLHIQAVSKFTMANKTGMGVLEQAIIGVHAPSGFKEFLDVAP